MAPTAAEAPYLWLGERFAVCIEYFAGKPKGGPRNTSVPLGTRRYMECAKALQAAIQRHFDEMVPVHMVSVDVPYALEVAVTPFALPLDRAKPNPPPALIYSKLEEKTWPCVEDILSELRRFCQLPARFQVFRPTDEDVAEAADSDSSPMSPVRGARLHVAHEASGTSVDLQVDDDGVAEAVLFPGTFSLSLAEGGAVDELSPSFCRLAAVFEKNLLRCETLPRQSLTLSVCDHAGRPVANLPLVLVRRAPEPEPGRWQLSQEATIISMRTNAAGLCACLLPEGRYTVSSGVSDFPSTDPFAQEFTLIKESPDAERTLRIIVKRVLFPVAVTLRTQGGEPVAGCPFIVSAGASRSSKKAIVSGSTSEDGVACMELREGIFQLRFLPAVASDVALASLNETSCMLAVNDAGVASPAAVEVGIRTAEVTIFFVDPAGEPAEHCRCRIHTREAGQAELLRLDSGGTAVARASLACFEHYVLRIVPEDTREYQPQTLQFSVHAPVVTIVVRRSLFGAVREPRLLVALDLSSGPVREQLPEVQLGLQEALEGLPDEARFDLLAHGDQATVEHWRPARGAAASGAAEAAAAWCGTVAAVAGEGGGSLSCTCNDPDPSALLEAALKREDVDAIVFLTGGDACVDELFLKRVQIAFYRLPRRPRIHAVLLNGEPRRAAWKHMQALALLSRGSFRGVSWPSPPPGAAAAAAAAVAG